MVIPIFALANAGVRFDTGSISGALGSRVGLGIIFGLVLGKLGGISLAVWVATRVGLARLPDEVSMRSIFGVAAVAGIGFTVSLFIANLAFTDPLLVDVSKIAVLAGSLVAGCLGAAMLAVGAPSSDGKER